MERIPISGSTTDTYSRFFTETVKFANIVQKILGAFVIDPTDPNHLIPTIRQGAPNQKDWRRDTSATVTITVIGSGEIIEMTIAITLLDGVLAYELRSWSKSMDFTPVKVAAFWYTDYKASRSLKRHIDINGLYYHQWLGCVEEIPVFPTGSDPYITIFEDIGGVLTPVQQNQGDAVAIIQQRHTIENFLHWLRGDPSPFRPPIPSP